MRLTWTGHWFVLPFLALLILPAQWSGADPSTAPATLPATAPATQPVVSARAWAIMDGATGKLLAGHEHDTPAKAASTTKIMCAYVILTLAEKTPAVLDEVVTISKFADDTTGSTADVRQGERIPVGDLLYGLMLPSGNDAGNALAEHFNDRFAPPAKSGETGDAKMPVSSRSNFVAEMNRVAQKLGMTRTTYRIPYGDGGGDDARTTTAADLLTLARTAMGLERFRRIVATEKYTAKITQPDGTQRSAEWTNTNRLLGKDGFDGVKTGTNRPAGACLVASQRRDGHHLLCVVLGSSSNDARYDDAQALLRWAWDQRGRAAATGDASGGEPLVTVQRGTLPIILTAPHGGNLPVPGADKRKGGAGVRQFFTLTDMRTAELTEQIAAGLERELGGRPYIIIARFQRSFADANRAPADAYEDARCGVHYDAFHRAIKEASADIRACFGRGLLLDIHGQAFQRTAIFRGTRQGQAVRDLLARDGNASLTGPTSIMGRLKSLGYETLPQPDGDTIGQEERYSGGYIIDAHGGHRDTHIDAMQMEFGADLRMPARLEQTANDTAKAIATFAREHLPRPATD